MQHADPFAQGTVFASCAGADEQHAAPGAQQAAPSTQQLCVAQHASPRSQQAAPGTQQSASSAQHPAVTPLAQQACGGLQQGAFAAQQGGELSADLPFNTLTAKTLNANIEPANNLVNINIDSDEFEEIFFETTKQQRGR